MSPPIVVFAYGLQRVDGDLRLAVTGTLKNRSLTHFIEPDPRFVGLDAATARCLEELKAARAAIEKALRRTVSV